MFSVPAPIIRGGEGVIWYENLPKFCGGKIFLTFVPGKTSKGRVKDKWASNIYYYITILLLFHFFRNSQNPEK